MLLRIYASLEFMHLSSRKENVRVGEDNMLYSPLMDPRREGDFFEELCAVAVLIHSTHFQVVRSSSCRFGLILRKEPPPTPGTEVLTQEVKPPLSKDETVPYLISSSCRRCRNLEFFVMPPWFEPKL